MERPPLRTAATALLVLTAGLFALGTTIERNTATPPARARSQQLETRAERAARSEGQEMLFVVDLETTTFVAVGIAISLLLAALVLFRGGTLVYFLAAGFGLVFAALDAREVIHQIDVGEPLLIAIAALLGALHVALAIVSTMAGHRSSVAPA